MIQLGAVRRYLGLTLLVAACASTQAAIAHDGSVDSEALIDKYCAPCHNSSDFAGGIDLEFAGATDIAARPQVGEKMIKRLRAGMMPPVGKERPD